MSQRIAITLTKEIFERIELLSSLDDQPLSKVARELIVKGLCDESTITKKELYPYIVALFDCIEELKMAGDRESWEDGTKTLSERVGALYGCLKTGNF